MLNLFNRLNALSIKLRLAIILTTLVLGFVCFGIATFKTMATLNVNGPVYQRIVQGKDIIADILPPPEYIIESYLVTLELSGQKTDTEIDKLIARFKTLKAEYYTRHDYWLAQALEQELNTPLLEDSYQSAKAFYDEAEQRFLPAIKNHNAEVWPASLEIMRKAYDQHRLSIDRVVAYANSRNAQDEIDASQTIKNSRILLLGIFAVSVLLAIGLAIVISRSILTALKSAQQVAEAIAVGNLDSVISANQQNEIGVLLSAMQKMQETLGGFVSAQRQLAKRHAEGWIHEQINASQFQGVYGTMADELNDLAAEHVMVNEQLIAVVTQYARGDFSADMTQLSGDRIKISTAINDLKTALVAVNGEIKTLVASGVQGDFSKSNRADQFEFIFKDILSDIDTLISTCESAFSDTVRVANALANGDLTQTVTRDYRGAFAEVKKLSG